MLQVFGSAFLVVTLLSDHATFREGVALLRAGKAAEAWTVLKRAEQSYGAEVPAELLADLALAAEGHGRFEDAVAYAERAASVDERFVLLRDTIVGSSYLQQAREAMQDAAQPDLGRAKLNVERAIAAFTRALTAQPEAPAARRNLERALLLQKEIDEQQKKEESKKDDEKKDDEKKDDEKKDDEKKDDGKKDDGKKDDEKKDDEKTDDEKKDSDKQDGEKKENEQPDQQQQKDGEQKDQQQQKDGEQKDQQQQDSEQKKSEQEQAKQDEAKPQDGKEEGKQQGEEGSKPTETTEQQGELSPAQVRVLQRQLEKLLEEQRKLRKAQAERSQAGKKGW